MRRSIPLPASAISSLKWIPHQHFQDSLACPSAERIAPSHFHLGCQPDLLSFVPDPLLFLCVYMLSCVRLFAIPWTAPHQASLSITNSQSLLKFVSIESVMPSNHLVPFSSPSICPSTRVFLNESVLRIRWPKYCILKCWELLSSFRVYFKFLFGHFHVLVSSDVDLFHV